MPLLMTPHAVKMSFRATRAVLRHASQTARARNQSSLVQRALASNKHGCSNALHSPVVNRSARLGSITRRPFGAGSLGDGDRDRPRDDEAAPPSSPSRRKFDALVARGRLRTARGRVRLEKLKSGMDVKMDKAKGRQQEHASWVRVAGKGSDLSMSQRMKRLVSAYGPLALGFHMTMEATTCGLFYLAVDHGLDVGALLQSVEALTGYEVPLPAGGSSLVVAYALTVALMGVPRTFLTIAATPYVAKKLGWRPKK